MTARSFAWPLLAGALVASAPAPARATAPGAFGHDPSSVGLAQADVADSDAANAPQANPALAADPGFRIRLGYAYGAMNLRLDRKPAGVRNVSGVDLSAQYGKELVRDWTLGLAIGGHIPDEHIARISFRPATEPQFVRYEASLARTALDLVAALRFRNFSLGGGVSALLDVGGKGTTFTLGQDGSGTYADAATDVELPYRFAPLIGARADLGPVALGASFRGALAVDLGLRSVNRVALTDNPLNGTTTVLVSGTSGYDPAVIDLGARVAIGGGFSAHAALEYAFYSAAPPPVADVVLDVQLNTSPSQRQAHFVLPRFRDTLSPRLGLELLVRDDTSRGKAVEGLLGETIARDSDWRFALTAGYVLSPSPVPRQTGLTSYADATRHGIALGSSLRLGAYAGVDLRLSLAGQLHVLAKREERKPSDALPHARYDVSGNILYGSAAIEGTWH